MIQKTTKRALTALLAVGVLAAAAVALAQGSGHQHGATPGAAAPAPAGRVVQEYELHQGDGVPRGWKFTLPPGGDPARGRKVFADLECYKCHLIKDGGFPPTGTDGKKGPELTGTGGHHPAEYFAHSILDPSAIIVDGPGHMGPDGRSIMPSFNDSLSVAQLLDLVAFLKSQTTGGEEQHEDARPQERTAGPYRVRLAFEPVGSASHAAGHGTSSGATQGHHHHHAPAPAGDKAAARAGHLMVFVTDLVTGEAVPYLPVSAALHAEGAQPHTVRLAPMLGARGFHYGADVKLPAGTRRIVLSIAAPQMRLMSGADRAMTRAHTVAFDWSTAAR
jgi:mono/diheme cytochrome c family protein